MAVNSVICNHYFWAIQYPSCEIILCISQSRERSRILPFFFGEAAQQLQMLEGNVLGPHCIQLQDPYPNHLHCVGDDKMLDTPALFLAAHRVSPEFFYG